MPTDLDPSFDLFNGLKALSDASFPKKCSFCGQEYASVDEYVKKTEDVRGHSGLKKGYDDDDKPIVELFRNCVCGSTLMDCFNDRRDASEGGLKRRKLFGKLMEMITAKGIDDYTARTELLKILRGEQSETLGKLGINTQVR